MTPMKENPRIQPQDETPEGKPKSSTSREQPTYDKPEGKPKSVTSEGKPRMTVTVDPHFFADPDPAVFLNAYPEPALKKCVINQLTYEIFSGVEKDKLRAPKSFLKNMELVQIYLICLIKLQILSISLHFSVFSSNFSLLDPHIEGGSRRENESGSTALG